MPVSSREFTAHHANLRGGMDVIAGHYERFPTRPLDLVNVVPTLGGYVGGPGWAIKGNEIDASTFGKVNHITGLATTLEANGIVAVCAKRFAELTSGTWTNRQGATSDFSSGTLDHAQSDYYKDVLYIATPVTGSANAIRQWTGPGNNVTALAGSPRNAGSIQFFGNRMCTARTWSGGGVLDGYSIYRAADADPTTSPGDLTTFLSSPAPIMRILRLGQMLLCYKQYGIGVLHINGGENSDLEPFEPDEIPTNVGLALPEAVARGEKYHCFVGNDNVYLLAGMEEPKPIGDPILPLIHDQLAAGSFILAGYDNRSPERNGFWFLTNFGHAASLFAPNSIATTYTYFYYDMTTGTWSRGELTTIPRAIGNYYNRFGYVDAAPISQVVMALGLESGAAGANTSIYEVDYTVAQRVGANFTRSYLSSVFYLDDVFTTNMVADAVPVFKNRSSGSLSLTWYTSDVMGETPGTVTGKTSAVISFPMNGTATLRQINMSGRFHQFLLTSTADFDLSGIVFNWKPRG